MSTTPPIHATEWAVLVLLTKATGEARKSLLQVPHNIAACTGEHLSQRDRQFGLLAAEAILEGKSPQESPLTITCPNCAAIVDAAIGGVDIRKGRLGAAVTAEIP